MILFALRCAADHEFEGWFRDGATFDRQSAGGKISCPQCGDKSVTKAPMAPRVARARNAAAAPSPAELRKALQELRRHVETHCDYVGERFAEEARRIHYGESDPRGIYGEASDDDAKDLAEEGIEVNRIPWLPPTDA
ncbi:MAG TPA: DUF1178 family protein [Stellaceae bacterium]|jgi:hypothetical protein|nr:DUF1178 family protein [Stellaceae bacterium]